MKRHLGIFLRGMAMGAADLVPGVSGGTVALITGIYDTLLESISSISWGLSKTLRYEGLQGVLKALNASFLITLVTGISTSFIALSGLLHHLLEHHKAVLFAFFFGLVSSSIPMVSREISKRNASHAFLFFAGTAVTFGLGSLPPIQVEPSLPYLFACGAVAACAMILPGISGSFILLLLGVYGAVIGALKELNLLVIATVGAGAITGLLGFSKGLTALLARARSRVMATLTGMLLGSLQALWPWKENILLLHTHSDGRETWLQTNAWPDSNEFFICLAFSAAGAGLVLVMQRLENRFAS